ncbi:hypothetical protein CLOBOL_06251 [Enterocloster bolteae ATCC BAA-613]|uniref:Uncharacterized protein n=1 Tax=Enterocloster bolteae (strain ATCC BAA-613 / DSM 15670 / CCUG 46953 / JCM 12243 / WAL 16351) TaxID=411902 RepID=A8S224_ENTBW|nr:hypothetical protein CLOBOL_06251 [Enterocloster bolteae ATCC BAA-613]
MIHKTCIYHVYFVDIFKTYQRLFCDITDSLDNMHKNI